MKNELTHLDLFSGIGGFAIAARNAGFRTIGFSEVEPFACRVLAERFPGVPNLGDVTKLCRRVCDCEPLDEETGEAICPRCGIDFGECDCVGTDQFTDTHGFPVIVTGGVPCQPASLIGERRGTEDERWLWPDAIRVVRELRPKYGLFENPAAILSLDDGRAFAGILGGLAGIGYDVLWDRVPASALGAGHRRERVWILASDADCAGLERHTGHVTDRNQPGRIGQEARGYFAAPDLRTRKLDGPKWYHQSGIQPVVNGVPGRVARVRLHAVGNALVPQVAEVFMRAIAGIETGGAS